MQVEIQILFRYVLQKVPRKGDQNVLTRHDDFTVVLQLDPQQLNTDGTPKPLALWYAEGQFLQAIQKKHLADVRVLTWSSYLQPGNALLSTYHDLIDKKGF